LLLTSLQLCFTDFTLYWLVKPDFITICLLLTSLCIDLSTWLHYNLFTTALYWLVTDFITTLFYWLHFVLTCYWLHYNFVLLTSLCIDLLNLTSLQFVYYWLHFVLTCLLLTSLQLCFTDFTLYWLVKPDFITICLLTSLCILTCYWLHHNLLSTLLYWLVTDFITIFNTSYWLYYLLTSLQFRYWFVYWLHYNLLNFVLTN
jgi:hypothetical protein